MTDFSLHDDERTLRPRRARSSAGGRRAAAAAVEPFEEGGRWGLRVGPKVVLRPVYRHIGPFVGRYAAFEFVNGLWGVLDRGGHQVLPPRFSRVEVRAGGRALLVRSDGAQRRVHLGAVLRDGADLCTWWLTEAEKRVVMQGAARLDE